MDETSCVCCEPFRGAIGQTYYSMENQPAAARTAAVAAPAPPVPAAEVGAAGSPLAASPVPGASPLAALAANVAAEAHATDEQIEDALASVPPKIAARASGFLERQTTVKMKDLDAAIERASTVAPEDLAVSAESLASPKQAPATLERADPFQGRGLRRTEMPPKSDEPPSSHPSRPVDLQPPASPPQEDAPDAAQRKTGAKKGHHLPHLHNPFAAHMPHIHNPFAHHGDKGKQPADQKPDER